VKGEIYAFKSEIGSVLVKLIELAFLVGSWVGYKVPAPIYIGILWLAVG